MNRLKASLAKMALRLSAVALILSSTGSAQAWWNADWTIRKSVNIDGASKEASLIGSLEDTVVLLRLHDGNFHFAGAAEDGSDIRIVAGEDKTLLPFHIEKYDSLLSEAFVWVRVPEVKAGEKTTLWIYYGRKKGGGERSENAAETYAGKVDAVYHFGEQGAAPADASGNENHAEGAGLNTSGAMIGGGLRLLGNAAVKIPSSSSLQWPANTSLSWSAWIRAGASHPNAVLFSRSEERSSFQIGVDNGTPYVEVIDNGSPKRGIAEKSLAEGTWQHLAVIVDSGKISFYLDGEFAGAFDAALPSLNSPLFIGRSDAATAALGFVGEIDELQITKMALSAEAVRFAAITQGGERAAAVVSMGDDEVPKGAFAFMEGGFVGIIMRSLTVDGWIVIGICLVMLVISWWIMYDKTRYVNRIAKANALFLEEWQHVANDLSVLEKGDEAHAKNLGGRVNDEMRRTIKNSSVYRIYHIGVREVRNRVARDKVAGASTGLTGRSMAAIRASLEGGFVREMQKLNSSMVLLTIAISGGPFLGLLGTVVGVMITFAAVAEAGDVNVNAIAPGIAAALAATVAGLAVAIPALFGYNYLLARVKEASANMQIFIDEFVTKAGEFYDNAKS